MRAALEDASPDIEDVTDDSSVDQFFGVEPEVLAKLDAWVAALKSKRLRAVATALIEGGQLTDREIADQIAPLLGKRLSVSSVTSARKQVVAKLTRSPVYKILRESLSG